MTWSVRPKGKKVAEKLKGIKEIRGTGDHD